jgi:hypothetical protein
LKEEEFVMKFARQVRFSGASDARERADLVPVAKWAEIDDKSHHHSGGLVEAVYLQAFHDEIGEEAWSGSWSKVGRSASDSDFVVWKPDGVSSDKLDKIVENATAKAIKELESIVQLGACKPDYVGLPDFEPGKWGSTFGDCVPGYAQFWHRDIVGVRSAGKPIVFSKLEKDGPKPMAK